MQTDILIISPESGIRDFPGYHVVYTAENRYVMEYERFHADMQLVKIGSEIITAPMFYDYYKKMLPGKKIVCGSINPDGHYPKSVAYNTAVTEKFAICNEKYTDRVILQRVKENGLEIINVKQGYSKCSLCVFPGGAITSDRGIYKKISPKVDTLLIGTGGVLLPGADYGFLGGASGFGDRLYFTGNIENHPDFKDINAFLEEKNIKYSYFPGELTDYGTALFV